ncbi:MAG: DUF554 domain-containing protein [Ruminococcaceae bacterium]|nr:DUF554 domain-containing protein [Oscillospiraceae bacterium]
MFGTLVNVLTVLIGSSVGLGIRCLTHGKSLGERSKRIFDAVFAALGLAVLLIGVGGAIKGSVNSQIITALPEGTSVSAISTEKTLAIILSMVVGVIIGELIDLDKQMNRLGEQIQKSLKGRGGEVANAFVSASLLFCVGSMTIVGAMQSGISGDHTLLITKSIMDLISSMVFALTMGVGVVFSVVFVFVYQGGITLLAWWLGPFLSGDVITCIGSVGSLVIIALGLNLMGLSKFKIMNFVPAIFLPIGFVPLVDWISTLI